MNPSPERSLGSEGADPESREIGPGEVQEQLRRIESSAGFRGSARLQRFLRIAIERTLAGQTDQLKEYAVGRDVFQRGERYDPRTDSIVRVEARRLRSKLRQYYQTEGASDPVVIRFPRGSYVPEFARAGQMEEEPAPPPAPTEKSWNVRTVAVLPFSNLSPEAEQQFFCDGITEDIINALTAVPDLQVIGRASMFAVEREDPREIGARLGAGTIIDGSVRKSGELLRISVKIIDAETRQAVWSHIYDRRPPDVFVIEDEIAHSIADTLRVPFEQAESQLAGYKAPTAEAHVLYLRGRQSWNRMTQEGFLSAIEIFRHANSLYPEYSPPYAGLADAYAWLAVWGMIRPDDGLVKARDAAREALRLDPKSAHALVSLGLATCFGEWNWVGGLPMVKAGLMLQPSYSEGYHICGIIQSCLGRLEDARQSLEKAVYLDPLSVRTNRVLGLVFYLAGRSKEAQQWFEAAIALQPDSAESYYLLARSYLQQQRYTEALDAARKCDTVPPSAVPLSILGVSLVSNGDRAGAVRILERLEEMAASGYVDPSASAVVHASLGNREEALRCLKRSIEEHAPLAAFINVDPLYEEFRGDAKFRELVGELRFP